MFESQASKKMKTNDVKSTNGSLAFKLQPGSSKNIPTIVKTDDDDYRTITEPSNYNNNNNNNNNVVASQDEIAVLERNLQLFSSSPDRWDILVAIGDIYARGAYPRWQPNTVLAMRCYKLAAMCPDGDVAGTAQVKAIDLRDHPLIDMDRHGAQIPIRFGEAACRLALDRIKSLPADAFQKPVSKFRRQQQEPEQQQEPQRPAVNQHRRAYIHDKQNVHDHSVVTGLKRVLAKLSARSRFDTTSKMSNYDIQRIKEAAIDSILTDNAMDLHQKTNAIDTVGALIGDQANGTIGTTEVHALALANDVIDNVGSEDLRKNLRETLNKQLASAVEANNVVCSTGRIARILGTFDGVPELQGEDRIRPIWAVREEIASLAAKVRSDVLGKLDESEVNAYNRGQRPNIEESMKKAFKSAVIVTYVEKLGMNKTLIDPIISQYSDAF